MSTYMQDMKQNDPDRAALEAITGHQPDFALRNMIRALGGPLNLMNTPEENARLNAAKKLLALRRKKR